MMAKYIPEIRKGMPKAMEQYTADLLYVMNVVSSTYEGRFTVIHVYRPLMIRISARHQAM
jgi:hypothetical protein